VDDAIKALNGQISLNPRDAESIHLLCRAYFQYEDWDRAESHCKKAVELQPGNSGFHRWLGSVYGEKANRKRIPIGLALKTRDELQRAAQLNPQDILAMVGVAEYYVDAPGIMGGGADKAREQARLIGKLDSANEHWVYARIAEKNSDFATAEREYRQMVRDGKGDPEAWLNLGFFYRNRKRFDDMEQVFVEASHATPPKPEVLFEMAANLYRTGRAVTFAVDLLKRYLAEGPVEEAPAFKAHHLLGLLLEKQGDKAAAAAEYRSALAWRAITGLPRKD